MGHCEVVPPLLQLSLSKAKYSYSDVSYMQKNNSFYNAFLLGGKKISSAFGFSKNAEKTYNPSAYFADSDTKDTEAGKSKALGHTA